LVDLLRWGPLAFSGVALIVSFAALWLSRRADRRASQKHEWEAKDREREVQRYAWCEAVRRDLQEHADDRGYKVAVTTERLADAKWGVGEGFFAYAAPTPEGDVLVQLPPGRPERTLRETIEWAWKQVEDKERRAAEGQG
jgi:hypothetical protein